MRSIYEMCLENLKYIKNIIRKEPMKTSQDGLEFIEKMEGNELKMYRDSAGLWTIAVGHLLTEEELKSKKFENGITRDQSFEILAEDVKKAEAGVNKLVKVPLTQTKFDVLVSFCFNLGEGALKSSTLLKKLNTKDYDAVPSELLKWNKVRNPKTKKLEVSKGLTKRREKEAELWKK